MGLSSLLQACEFLRYSLHRLSFVLDLMMLVMSYRSATATLLLYVPVVELQV
jgi:hypothetical protein